MRRAFFIAAACLFAVCLAPAPFAQESDGERGARERWERKSPEEREVLRRRFDELQRMSAEERSALEDLARKLKASEDRARDNLSGDLRRQLAELPPPDRDGVFREHFHGVLRRRGEAMRDRLPPEMVEGIESVPPRRRPHHLHELLTRERALKPEHVRRIGEHLGASEGELAGLEGLAPEELEDRALRFHRDHIDRRVEELGPPPGIDAAGYAAMRDLSHREFFRRWHALDPSKAYAPKRRRGGRDSEGPGSDPSLSAGLSREARERVPLIREALNALEPTMADRIEFAGLSDDEQGRALARRARERCLGYLDRHGILTDEERAELQAAEGSSFRSEARRILKEKKHGLLGGRGSRRGGFGGGRRGGERGPDGQPLRPRDHDGSKGPGPDGPGKEGRPPHPRDKRGPGPDLDRPDRGDRRDGRESRDRDGGSV